jgi:hypothetical protein
MSRVPHFLNNLLKDVGEVVILTSWPPFTSRKIPLWLYDTSRKVEGLIPDEVIGFFQLIRSFQPHYNSVDAIIKTKKFLVLFFQIEVILGRMAD